MSTQVAALDPRLAVPEEERAVGRQESYDALVRRLSHQSVVKHFDAYADIAWDSEEFRIDPADLRWDLGDDDPLGASEWYRSQPASVRARLGLHLVASFMKIGLQFEGVLKQGLLAYASRLPNRSVEFRYVYHEVIEEAQHSLMFQEFVDRSGFDLPGLTGFYRFMAGQVTKLASVFPALFFIFVLGGEDPIDHVQRRALRRDPAPHPLLRRIMQIHVTEEARHLCFARHYLKENVGRLGPVRRSILGFGAPVILGLMAQLMMRPSPAIVREYAIPREVIDEVYTRNPRHRETTIAALAKVRNLCHELGLITPLSQRLWQAFGIWA